MCSSFLFLFFIVEKDDTTPKIKIKFRTSDPQIEVFNDEEWAGGRNTLYSNNIPKLSVEGVDIKQYIIGCQRRKTKNASGCICKCNETSFIENYLHMQICFHIWT